jgi:hypothetical protein
MKPIRNQAVKFPGKGPDLLIGNQRVRPLRAELDRLILIRFMAEGTREGQ